MDFFNKIGSTITSKSQEVIKKAKDVTDTAKLNSMNDNDMALINKAFIQIGKMYYEETKNSPLDTYVEMFEAIQQAEVRIAERKEEISKIKGTHQCSNCGTELSNQAAFCSVCGAKNDYQENNGKEDASFCPNCGTAASSDSAFCPSCGTKIK